MFNKTEEKKCFKKHDVQEHRKLLPFSKKITNDFFKNKH